MDFYGTVRFAVGVIVSGFVKQWKSIGKRNWQNDVELINQIENYITEAGLLTNIITQSNFMIDKLDGRPDLQEPYYEEIEPIIHEYLDTIKALKFLFEEYFDWEKKIQNTRNLRYRRYYSLIVQDLAKPVPPTQIV